MGDVSPADRQVRWARRIAAALVGHGIEHVVVSPGSRSTPLVLALAEREDVALQVVLDERAAAFVALGRARVTGTPCALLCTSGSAGTHYHPAVVEASHARLPLLAITADRPEELHGRDAPQTIDQRRLFGDHVRAAVELGAVPADEPALAAVGEAVARAVAAARAPEPGPVHVNVRFRKPFEPPTGGERTAPPEPAPAPRTHAARAVPDEAALDELAEAIRASRRGLIVAGPAPLPGREERLHEAPELAREADLPLAAEAASQLRFDGGGAPWPRIDGYEPLLRCGWWVEQRPDLVLQVGSHPTSSRWPALWAALEGPRHVLARTGWHDPAGGAAIRVLGDPRRSLAGLRERLRAEPGERRDWVERVRAADRIVHDEVLARAGEQAPWSEGRALRAAVGALPRGGLLQLANSLPVREVDVFCEGELTDAGVLHQRGAMGIDGLIAGAAGAARAAGRPLLALTGDVAFAHDAGSLSLLGELNSPLVLLVLDNAGGRLFEALPIGAREDLAQVFERCFLTPPPLDAARVAAGFGLPVEEVDDAAALQRAVADGLARPGARVVVARLAGARGSEALQRELAEHVGLRLAGEGLGEDRAGTP
jgi:2-succinyl-5-enolpyruvyl-6-hydroxy-3-cyclohexene-1-carboxylate synthase